MTFDQWADSNGFDLDGDGHFGFADLRTTAAEQGWNAAIDQAAAIVLADCVNPPKTEYQHQYNATLRHTAAQILKLKEST